MKAIKTILFTIILLVPVCLNAQVKVDSNGKLNIGSYPINNNISFYDVSGTTPFKLFRQNNHIVLSRSTSTTQYTGVRLTHDGRMTLHPSGNINGGLGARLELWEYDRQSALQTVVDHDFNYGAAIASNIYNPLTVGFTVNLRNKDGSPQTATFRVLGNGEVYSAGQYTFSDSKVKKNITQISNSLNKVMQLRGVEYESLMDETTKQQKNKLELQTREIFDENDINKPISVDVQKQIQSEADRKHVGVIAQEVEAVLPHAVRTTPEGIKAVNYSELIPLLIEAIKEQQAQINELKNGNISKPVLRSEEVSEKVISTLESEVKVNNKLYQNTPNPFSDNTEIKYSISESATKANLYIYDMQGRQIKNISNLKKGDGSAIISGTELKAGMYIYSLIVDGIEVDTKRMILTD